jgi:hypothetical protein
MKAVPVAQPLSPYCSRALKMIPRRTAIRDILAGRRKSKLSEIPLKGGVR